MALLSSKAIKMVIISLMKIPRIYKKQIASKIVGMDFSRYLINFAAATASALMSDLIDSN